VVRQVRAVRPLTFSFVDAGGLSEATRGRPVVSQDEAVRPELPPALDGLQPPAQSGNQVTKRQRQAAAERAEELRAGAAASAEALLVERAARLEARLASAEKIAADEQRHAAVIGTRAAKMISDTKSKSTLLQNGESLAGAAKSALQESAEFKRLHGSLAAGQRLNAASFLASSREVMNDVLANRREHEEVLGSKAQDVQDDLDDLADESDHVKRMLTGANKIIKGNSEGAERLARLKEQGTDQLANAEHSDQMANDAFVEELKQVVATYISEAVTSIEIPPITGSKDWGDFEITGINVRELKIVPDDIIVDIGETVEIKLLNIASVFDNFDWNFAKTSFPRMKDAGNATAEMRELSATVSFALVVDEGRKVVVDDLLATITLGAMDVSVSGGGASWLYNKLLKLFSTRVKVRSLSLKERAVALGRSLARALSLCARRA
jgi:hypothetical protein